MNNNDFKNYSVDFMLKEYERLTQIKIDENRQSEQRVNFFLALVTGSIAGIIILSQAEKIEKQYIFTIIQCAQIILLLFGVKLLNKLHMRSLELEKNYILRNNIQKYFAKKDPEIDNYIKLSKNPLKRKDHNS